MTRIFDIDEEVDVYQIKATMKNGMLCIRMPMNQREEKHVIDIEDG